jgi:hypothetical protein
MKYEQRLLKLSQRGFLRASETYMMLQSSVFNGMTSKETVNCSGLKFQGNKWI